jgi:hypothetical protein
MNSFLNAIEIVERLFPDENFFAFKFFTWKKDAKKLE